MKRFKITLELETDQLENKDSVEELFVELVEDMKVHLLTGEKVTILDVNET